MTLFRESDKRITPGVVQPESFGDDDDDDDEQRFDQVEYAAPASVIRDRLDIMGFSLDAATGAFEVAIEHERTRHAEFIREFKTRYPEHEDKEGAVLSQLTAETWMEGIRYIRTNNLLPSYRTDPELELHPLIVAYLLGKYFDGWYGFPGADIRHAIRMAVEVCINDELVYDLTDLVSGGYYDATDDVVATADYFLTENFESTRRIIVLTEGASDKWILERSLRILYPHLADYYTFMDFEGARVAGGAGALASMVKAFVGAGILNRVVALFDNDTAGASAMRQLAAIRMPTNIVPICLPRLATAEDYPTIGPSGNVRMDVNGLAASLELYLGTDVLSVDGAFAPVLWKGYDEGMRQYQGEVMNKRSVHDRFASKLSAAEEDPSKVAGQDWAGMQLIMSALRGAFKMSDRDELVAIEAAYK